MTKSQQLPLSLLTYENPTAAQRYVLCTYNVERKNQEAASRITPGRRAPTVTALDNPGWVAVQAMVERSRVALAMDELAAVGATDILITNIENSRCL